MVLHDLTHEAPEHEATLPVEEVSLDDRRLLKPGAVFYWIIGYKRHRSGQQERGSAVRIRRLPGWSRRDDEAAIVGRPNRSALSAKLAIPPKADELEVSVFGPGIGECVVVHAGAGEWMIVDSCVDRSSGLPVAL